MLNILFYKYNLIGKIICKLIPYTNYIILEEDRNHIYRPLNFNKDKCLTNLNKILFNYENKFYKFIGSNESPIEQKKGKFISIIILSPKRLADKFNISRRKKYIGLIQKI